MKAKRLYRLLKNAGKLSQERKKIQVFAESVHLLPLSDKKIYSDETKELFEYIDNNYDLVIAGSDAIWNYVVHGFPNPYFLSDTLKCKKYSYAASVYGMNYESIPPEDKFAIAKILNSYELLSARDDESINFVQEIGCKTTPIHVCDPTVFLDVDNLPIDKEALMKKIEARGFDFSKKTIGMMGTDTMGEMIRKMYGNQFQIVSLFQYTKAADVNLYDLSPFEWAYMFRFFEVTFTTYFHGTLVSLRNGTPVISIALINDYSKKHMTKVEDFLLRVGLHDCYFSTDYKTQNLDAIKAKADYFLANDTRQKIVQKIDAEAKTFLPFLDALEKAHTKNKERDGI